MAVDSRLSTRATALFGVDYPVVQTGMGWVAGPSLVTGTAEAGGLGILAAATMSLDEMARAIEEVQSRTSKPFGVNLRTDAVDIAQRVDHLIRAEVRVASFAQAPRPDVVERLKDGGVAVMPTVGARRHAEKVASYGVDAVLCQGGEGGGHTRGGAHVAAAAPGARRGGRTGDRGRRLPRRPGPGRRPGLGSRRHRHGHPLPAHRRLQSARRGQAGLPGHRRGRHRGHPQRGRGAPAADPHRVGGPAGTGPDWPGCPGPSARLGGSAASPAWARWP